MENSVNRAFFREDMHKSLDEMMWPNRYMLSAIGIWPLDSSSGASAFVRYFSIFRIAVTVSSTIFMVYPLITTIVIYWGNVDVLAGVGSVAIMYALGGFKHFYMAVRHRACTRIYRCLRSMWDASTDRDERASFEPLAILARKITLAVIVFVVIDIVAFMTTPVIVMSSQPNGSFIFPLPAEYGFGHDSKNTFVVLYVAHGVGATISSTAIYGTDTIFMSVVCHLAAQFRLLNFRLKVIGRKFLQDGPAQYDGRLIAEEMRLCIAHHQRTISITKEVNSVMEPLVFAQIATSGLTLCLCCFLIISNDPLSIELMKIYVLLIVILLQLVNWCWPGEIIIQESGAVARTIYHDLPWPSLPASLQRDLNFVVLRAQKECQIVGFYQVMSKRKLTEVFNAAGSYIALLRSIRD